EGAYVRANVNESDVIAVMPPYRNCNCMIEARTAQYLGATQAEVVPFYRLEKAGAFASPTAGGKSFAIARLGAGAAELRDMVIDAWHESANAKIGYPPVLVSDVESGKADALGPLQGED